MNTAVVDVRCLLTEIGGAIPQRTLLRRSRRNSVFRIVESTACAPGGLLPRLPRCLWRSAPQQKYFDPLDVEAIANSLEQILCSRDLWDKMRKPAIEQAVRSTCESCARDTMTSIEVS